MAEWLPVLLLLAGTAGAGAFVWAAWRLLDRLNRQLLHEESARAEALRLARADRQIADIQQATRTVIAVGNDVVRGVHRGISAWSRSRRRADAERPVATPVAAPGAESLPSPEPERPAVKPDADPG